MSKQTGFAFHEPGDDGARGLVCRQCGCTHFEVVWVRHKPRGRVLRRRECRYCKTRVTTVERIIG